MYILLVILGAAALLELGVYFIPLLWRARTYLVPVQVLADGFASGALIAFRPGLFSALFLVVSLYRLFNAVRITQGRMYEGYLRFATRRTGLVLLLWQAAILLAWLAWGSWHTTGHTTWAVVAGLQVVVASVLLVTIMRRLRRTSWPNAAAALADHDLPTVTVAVPARNETADLADCLQSIIASDYPKLEILVLDDCSQGRRTVDIIRDFAHDGVRFIQGETPQPTWLAKNQAYDRLLGEASGELVLFCGVDVRFAPGSIRQMVATLQAKHKKMLCLLPWRASTATGFALTQAMRYWWELAPPRRLFGRPPVLSSCWIAQKQALTKAGGFAAVTRSIVPEAYFARQLRASDGYSFLRANARLGVQSLKPTPAQQETVVRTRYPQVHKRPENVLLVSAAQLLFVVLPFVLAAAGHLLGIGLAAQLLAVLTAVLLSTAYMLLTLATRTGTWWFGLVGAPVGSLYDIGLLHYSMWQYEFATVEWKGRNVCIPAMHVISHLPRLD